MLNGGRLLSIVYNNVKIIESYNFIPLALSKCPITFGLNELGKGYFPYLFNTSINPNRILQTHPPEDMYGVKYMTTKLNNKLLFVLCYTCGRNFNRQTCNHSNSERAIEGTWVTEEVKQAVKKGYIILKIFSVWHFNDSNVYDKSTKTGGLFTEYINKFLKMKTEASGFPERLKSQDEKQKYIEDYEAHEGVRLDIDKPYQNYF